MQKPLLVALLLAALPLSAFSATPERATDPAVQPPPPGHLEFALTVLGPRAALPFEDQRLAAETLDYLSYGMEDQADQLFTNFLAQHPDDQKAMLLHALVVRSRLDLAGAKPLFEKTAKAKPGTLESQCADLMLKVDFSDRPTAAFNTLATLARKNPDLLHLQWTAGLAAHHLHRTEDGLAFLLKFLNATGCVMITPNCLYCDLVDEAPPADPQFLVQNLKARNNAVKTEPASWSYRGLAQTELLLKHYDKAAEAVNSAVKFDPGSAANWKLWANVLYASGHYQDAIAKCRQALELDPHLATAHVTWALALEKLNQPDEAFTHYQIAATGDPALPAAPETKQLRDTKSIRALSPQKACEEIIGYLAAGRQSEAESIATDLVVRHPEDPTALFLNGVLIRSRFDASRAALFFRRMLQVDKQSPRAHCALLLALIDFHQAVDETFDHMCDLARDNAGDPLILWSAAIAARTLNRNPEGVNFYTQLIKHFPTPPSLFHQTFANVLDESCNYELSLAHRKLTVQLEPRGWAYQGLANTLSSLQLFPEAYAAYAQATTLTPDSPLFWETWGNSMRKAGRFDDAIPKLQEAIRLNPHYALAFYIWGCTLESQNKFEEALVKYQTACTLDPNSQARLQAAQLLEKMGQKSRADSLRAQAAR